MSSSRSRPASAIEVIDAGHLGPGPGAGPADRGRLRPRPRRGGRRSTAIRAPIGRRGRGGRSGSGRPSAWVTRTWPSSTATRTRTRTAHRRRRHMGGRPCTPAAGCARQVAGAATWAAGPARRLPVAHASRRRRPPCVLGSLPFLSGAPSTVAPATCGRCRARKEWAVLTRVSDRLRAPATCGRCRARKECAT